MSNPRWQPGHPGWTGETEDRRCASLSRVQRRYTDEDLCDALRTAEANGISGGTEYNLAQRQMGLPTLRTIVLRFTTWNAARRAAGLPVVEDSPTAGMTWRVDPLECIYAVARCAIDLGHVPVIREYDGWRADHPLRNRRMGVVESGALPSSASIRGRVPGGWNQTKKLAAAALRLGESPSGK